MQQLATTYGAAGGRRGWIIWFTMNYPAATSLPPLPSRQIAARLPGWCPPQPAPLSLETLRRIKAALDRL
jgi:hypothetical protein